MRDPDATLGPYRERNVLHVKAFLVDTAGDPIPGSVLDNAYLSLYSEHGPREFINDRNRIDVTAQVDEDGLLTLDLGPDDMALGNEARSWEYHRALIEWYWTPTDAASPVVQEYGSSELRIVVQNLYLVPGGSPPSV